MGMIDIKRFILVMGFVALAPILWAAPALAQESDTAIKPLPDFIQNRPNVEEPETTPPGMTGDEASPLAAPESSAPSARIDMSDVPDSYIIEASKFGEECRNDKEFLF